MFSHDSCRVCGLLVEKSCPCPDTLALGHILIHSIFLAKKKITKQNDKPIFILIESTHRQNNILNLEFYLIVPN